MKPIRLSAFLLAVLMLLPLLASCGHTYSFGFLRPDTTATEANDPAGTDPTEKDSGTAASGEAREYLARALNTVDYNTGGERLTDPDFLARLSAFSGRLYEMCAAEQTGNYVLSPVSVWFALAILNAIGDEGVHRDVEKLTGMTQEDLALAGRFFLGLSQETSVEGTPVSRLTLTDSIWIDSGVTASRPVLDRLAEELYCYAHEAPFASDNRSANQALRDFVREKTNGLIDQDFDLQPDTLFALVNTLYLKDVWNLEGGTLYEKDAKFRGADGTVTVPFLTGYYYPGEAMENDLCRYCYTKTACGYRMIFLLPKDGHTLAEVMTGANLEAVNATTDYRRDPGDGKTHYTRCIFPTFRLESETQMDEILPANGYLENAFRSFYTELTDEELCISEILHRAVLKVDKDGVEGAAVTIIAIKATSAGPDDSIVYHDFEVNRSFGFLLTDPTGAVLFAGQVTTP